MDGHFTLFLRALHNVAQNSLCNVGRLCRFLHPVLFFDVSKKRTASIFRVAEFGADGFCTAYELTDDSYLKATALIARKHIAHFRQEGHTQNLAFFSYLVQKETFVGALSTGTVS